MIDDDDNNNNNNNNNIIIIITIIIMFHLRSYFYFMNDVLHYLFTDSAEPRLARVYKSAGWFIS